MISLRRAGLILTMAIVTSASAADPPLVTIRSPDINDTFWVGQRIPLFVELWAKGSFEGASSFSLPQIPQTVFVKVGNPVVSSQDRDGDSWFVQTHEFALFTQAAGELEIPEFPVRFSNHEGFTGPVSDHDEIAPGTKVEIKSPPDRQSHGFLVTTDKVDISESWNPPPGKIKQGDIVVRTIQQSANQMTGMALQPPPSQAPAGVKIYPDQPEVSDKTERGDFTGARNDRITYRFDRPGSVTIPQSVYTWWNPDQEKFESKTLPAVTFDVAADFQPTVIGSTPAQRPYWIVGLAFGLAILLLGIWRYRPLQKWLTRQWRIRHPPDRVAARQLLHACRRSDVRQAETAWAQWQSAKDPSALLSEDLLAAIAELHRSSYGSGPLDAWKGGRLAHAFRRELQQRSKCRVANSSALPTLNP